MANLSTPEPDPIPNNSRAIWDLVIQDLKEVALLSSATLKLMIKDSIDRDNLGKERYGTRLQANNGRDFLKDAVQEAMDLVVYLRQGMAEHKEPFCSDLYVQAMTLWHNLRIRLFDRDGR